MDAAGKAAFIISQSVAAMIECESMKAANEVRESDGYAPAYSEEAFLSLIDNYGLGHNSVLDYLKD